MVRTIQVSSVDISLFHVAARRYSDATAWLAVADANGISRRICRDDQQENPAAFLSQKAAGFLSFRPLGLAALRGLQRIQCLVEQPFHRKAVPHGEHPLVALARDLESAPRLAFPVTTGDFGAAQLRGADLRGHGSVPLHG